MSYPQTDFLQNTSQDENIYLLGFLWADGYVEKAYRIGLELRLNDFNQIKPLLKKYGFNHFTSRIRKRHGKLFGNPQGSFNYSNKNLNAFLQSMDYRKKSTVSPSKILSIIPENKKYLWWRGFFEGDGCFYCIGAQRKFTIWGSLKQDWTEVYSLYKQLGIDNPLFFIYKRENGKHCSSCILVSQRNDIQKIGNYIYQNKLEIGLERKYKKYLQCISTPMPRFQKLKSLKKGVYFSIWTGRWIVRKTINHKRLVLGSFSNYQKACSVYDNFSDARLTELPLHP